MDQSRFQNIATSYEASGVFQSPRNYLPHDLDMLFTSMDMGPQSSFLPINSPNKGVAAGSLPPQVQPLSPVNGARGTPFQFQRHRQRLKVPPLAHIKENNLYYPPTQHPIILSPAWNPVQGEITAPTPYSTQVTPSYNPRAPAACDDASSPACRLLDEAQAARTPQFAPSITLKQFQQLQTPAHQQLGSFQFNNDNIENFEPGSPAWKPSSTDQPLTPNFRQYLKSPHDESHGPKLHKKEGANKLGPDKYKSLRVSGKNSKPEATQHTKRGEKLGQFYDPAFDPEKNNFRNSHTVTNPPSKPTHRHQEKKQSYQLYKTELCTNWMLTSNCTYGNKCHFAHGIDDLKARARLENFKTQPCCDPARDGSRRCLYGSRCNYCHPGEAIRRPVGSSYYDKDYYRDLELEYAENKYPFGIYV